MKTSLNLCYLRFSVAITIANEKEQKDNFSPDVLIALLFLSFFLKINPYFFLSLDWKITRGKRNRRKSNVWARRGELFLKVCSSLCSWKRRSSLTLYDEIIFGFYRNWAWNMIKKRKIFKNRFVIFSLLLSIQIFPEVRCENLIYDECRAWV